MSSASQTSWINGSLTEAADMLSKRAVVTRRIVDMKKKSVDLSSVLGSVGGFLSDNPMMTKAIIGAGVGAGIGGLTSMAKPKKKRNVLRSMLTGVLAGGGLGVGAHYLGKAFPSGSGSTSFEHGGRQYELDPRALSANPAAMKELNELMATRPGEGVVSGVQGLGREYVSRNPIIASILGADIATQAAGTLGGMSSTGRQFRISQRPDVLQKGFEFFMSEKPEGLGKELMTGVQEVIEGKSVGPLKGGMMSALERVKGVMDPPNDKAARQLLRDAQRALVTGAEFNGITPAVAKDIKKMVDQGHGVFRRGGLASLGDIFRGNVDDISYPTIMAGTGNPPHPLYTTRGKWYGTNTDLPKWFPKWLGGRGPSEVMSAEGGIADILKNIKGKEFGLAGRQAGSGLARTVESGQNPFRNMGRFGRIGPRVGLYAGLPLAQAYFGAASGPGAREKRILKLVKELSK